MAKDSDAEGRHPKRRWYDRRSNDEWAQHVAEDPWRQHIVDQLDKLRRDLLIRYIILVLALVGCALWVFFVNKDTQNASKEAHAAAQRAKVTADEFAAQATEAKAAAQAAQEAVRAVQNSRLQAAVDQCHQQNKAHNNTVRFVHILVIRQAKATGTDPKKALKAAEPFLEVEDRSIPFVKDCKAHAEKIVTNGT